MQKGCILGNHSFHEMSQAVKGLHLSHLLKVRHICSSFRFQYTEAAPFFSPCLNAGGILALLGWDLEEQSTACKDTELPLVMDWPFILKYFFLNNDVFQKIMNRENSLCICNSKVPDFLSDPGLLWKASSCSRKLQPEFWWTEFCSL